MDLADRTVMLLGGSGLVGHAVARRLLEVPQPPRRLVLVALFDDEVRAAAKTLEPYRNSTAIEVESGNVFMPEPVARLDVSTDRKSTRLNSSHGYISYAVFCLKKKKKTKRTTTMQKKHNTK